MKTWGLSYGHHDAASVVFDGFDLIASKRYGKSTLNSGDVNLLINQHGFPDKIIIHENKRRDAWRKIKTGDWTRLLDGWLSLPIKPVYGNHHLSHAAYGYYTSPFRGRTYVIVADAVGELETLGVYVFNGSDCMKVYQLNYPNSLGLFYSYHTARLGFTPNKEEHKTMELATQRGSIFDSDVRNSIWFDRGIMIANHDLHKRPKHEDLVNDTQKRIDTAATAQAMLEEYFVQLLETQGITKKDNIVFVGGVAYNSILVDKLRARVKQLHVPCYPGDAGSALGCVLVSMRGKCPFIDESELKLYDSSY